jgi:hypothetical protein
VKITWPLVWAVHRFFEELLLHGVQLVLKSVGYTRMGIVEQQVDDISEYTMKFFLIVVCSF